MIPKTTIYYGKKYGLVYTSKSRSETNIYADVINKIFGDYNKGAIRKKLQNIKTLVITDNDKDTYLIYVLQPYDKLVTRK